MKELSQIASTVRASTTLAIDAMFKQMKADGIDVIGFGAGEPDFHTPDNIKEAGYAAIRDNFTCYTPTAGIPELRKAACDRLKADCGLDYTPAQIVMASGAKHALYGTLHALLDPGDEVIVPAPFWVTYFEMVRMLGAVPVIVTAEESAGFKLTPEQLSAAVTPKTKAILLNNPSNPTGMVYSKEELRALADVCVANDLYIVADEIYYRLVYDGRPFTSIAALGEDVKERTILINGVSKSYAMTGWRVGYAAAPEHIAKVISNYLSHSTGAPCSIAQKAAAVALGGPQETVEEMRKAFEQRRDHLVERIPEILEHYIKAWRGTYSVRVLKTPSTVCNQQFSEEIVPFAAQILGEENVKPVPPMKGAEDFGHVTRLVPGFYAFMGAGSPEGYPLHNPNMVLDESALPLGSAILANCAVKWLNAHADK